MRFAAGILPECIWFGAVVSVDFPKSVQLPTPRPRPFLPKHVNVDVRPFRVPRCNFSHCPSESCILGVELWNVGKLSCHEPGEAVGPIWEHSSTRAYQHAISPF